MNRLPEQCSNCGAPRSAIAPARDRGQDRRLTRRIPDIKATFIRFRGRIADMVSPEGYYRPVLVPEKHREAVETYVAALETRDVRDVRGDLDERDDLRN